MATYRKEFFSNDVKEIIQPDVDNIKSRYDTKIRLRMNDNKLVVRTLKSKDLVATQSSNDIVHTVTPTEAHRPENISLKYYGDARLYWVILAANNMRDRSELKNGMVITIPALKSLYGNGGILI